MNRIRNPKMEMPLSLVLKYNLAWLASLVLMALLIWKLLG